MRKTYCVKRKAHNTSSYIDIRFTFYVSRFTQYNTLPRIYFLEVTFGD